MGRFAVHINIQSRRFLTLALPVTAAAIISLSLLLALALASQAIDEVAAQRQRVLVTLTVAKLEASVAHDQESATVWDDAVRNASERNMDWLDTNLGAWMHSYFDHDAAVVLGQNLKPIYQFIANGPNAPRTNQLEKAYRPLAEKLQSRLASGDRSGVNNKTLSIGEADVAFVGFRPAVVSVKPIVSDTGDIEQAPGSENLHVAVRFLDGDLPTLISRDYGVENLSFSVSKPKDDQLSFVALTARSGGTVGYFHWIPFRPGQSVLQATRPMLGFVFVAIFTAASLAGGMFWRRSARLEESQAELRHQATHDALTGLANRAYFTQHLDTDLKNARQHETHSVLFIDLDKFKEVNDTLGHPVGDRLIADSAQRLRELLPTALIARIGGDEFTIHLAHQESGKAEETAEAVVAALRTPFLIDGVFVSVGASVGLATSVGPANGDELTRHADIALYHAKAAGRNTYAVFGAHMDELLKKRRALEHDLREAVENKIGIEVHYQPVFSAETNTVVSLEALVRWQHPELGFISPDIFIPVAEDCGAINQIGAIVLEDACTLMADFPDIDVAINASPSELAAPGYPLRVLSALAKAGIKPSRLEIELTESAAADENGRVAQTVSTLRNAGIRFAIDDFGTGYSSFSRIQKIEADRIKIDRSFINEMHKEDSRALVIAMINMAQAKGLMITAEGVETHDQREQLMKLGCDHLQGFLLSRPLGPAAARALLADATQECATA
ncbi:EAL domain-containing protein [Rhizobiales bacterium RZME27]|jgi:diguanylate cyclase (GGDEF)-like protein|uniref:EAL domain-containing protein n=1 Tax=Endobacterium cereale TaxID=2663029 RepID=A0A6A8A5W9_9HYPH|nr:EAL domain-containing protein [Endobacterium cereale]